MVLESVDKMWDDDLEKPAGTFFWSKYLQKRPVMFDDYWSTCKPCDNSVQDSRGNLDLVMSLVSNVTVCQEVTENKFRSFQSQRSPLVMWGRASHGRAPVISDNNFVAVVKKV